MAAARILDSTKGGKPNLLIVVADQLAAPFLPAYGHPVVKTPNIDRLAREGVVFENMSSNSPLCAPARATFMSGLLSSNTGVYDNAAEFRSSIPTFAHYLRLEGYRTCLSGKMHFVGPDQLHGFEERLTTDIYPADFGWTPDWSKPQERIDWWYHNMTSVKQAGIAEITNQLEYDDEVAFLARRRIFDFAALQGSVAVLPDRVADAPARSLRQPRALLEPLPRRGHRLARDGAGFLCGDGPAQPPAARRLRHGRLRGDAGRHPQLPARLLRQPLLCRRSRRGH